MSNKKTKKNKKTINKNKNKNRKTKRNYGGADIKNMNSDSSNQDSKDEKKERQGIFDFVSKKGSEIASSAGNYLYPKALRLFGVKPIKKEDEQEIKKNEEIDKAFTDTTNDVTNLVTKSTATVIEGVNNVIGSSLVNETVSQAAENTEKVTKKLLENINDKFENPEFKEELKESLENGAEVAEITLKALDKPINTTIDKMNEAGTKALSGISSSAIKVGTDIVAAVPGVGAIVDLGKIANDFTKGASAVVEAGSEAVEAGSDLFIDTKKGIETGIKEMEEKKEYLTENSLGKNEKEEKEERDEKKEGLSDKLIQTKEIQTRIGGSISDFMKTNKCLKSSMTKKQLINSKKTKKVRFSI